MNGKEIFRNRRTLIAAIGLFPWLSTFAFASDEAVPTAPCNFPFDASKNDAALDMQFRVKVYRNYIFTLEFHHKGGDDGMRVLKLVGDGAYKIFTRESADTVHPVHPNLPNTLEGSMQMDAGMRAGKFVKRPTDFSGAIPIHIRVSTEKNQISEAMTDEIMQTLGTFAYASGRIDRMITVIALKPGLYRLQANTTQDSPRFANVPIRLGITYHPNTKPLPLAD